MSENAETVKSRQVRWRAQQRAKGIAPKKRQRPKTAAEKAARKAWNKAHPRLRSERPFVGCDGEGAGRDELGRQLYLLFRMGAAELYRDGAALGTAEILDFICNQPRNRVYVGFGWDYDVTMILRDVCDACEPPTEEDTKKGKADGRNRYLDRMFMSDIERKKADLASPYVYWRNFAIHYLPRQFFRVARVGPDNKIVPKSVRTIYETIGFFQESFCRAEPSGKLVGAIPRYEIGTAAEREAIAEGKARRGGETKTALDPEDRAYCEMECRLMGELMQRFRTLCYEAPDGGLHPRTWNGAGKLAAAMHAMRRTPRMRERMTEKQIADGEIPIIDLPQDVAKWAQDAYFGGRFEIIGPGRREGRIFGSDINSAYPAAMLSLPCLVHGEWHQFDGDAIGDSEIYVADVSFKHGKDVAYCGLPIRSLKRRLSWPRAGFGRYWSCEIEAARRHCRAKLKFKGGWRFEKKCDCDTFGWVQGLYDYRVSLDKSVAGYPIKFAINSLYGQLARRVGGGGPWSNPVWAGLITARTRAALMGAAGEQMNTVIMFATDGIHSTEPLTNLSVGPGLGQWEQSDHTGMFVAQPGLYWGPSKPKTRGIKRGKLTEFIPKLESAWDEFMVHARAAGGFPNGLRLGIPVVGIDLEIFTPLRLAHARGKSRTAGIWSKVERNISFNWEYKRALVGWRRIDGYVTTKPLDGSALVTSFTAPAGPDERLDWQELGDMLAASPDFTDMAAPGFDWADEFMVEFSTV